MLGNSAEALLASAFCPECPVIESSVLPAVLGSVCVCGGVASGGVEAGDQGGFVHWTPESGLLQDERDSEQILFHQRS
jgi:hypothetical protein